MYSDCAVTLLFWTLLSFVLRTYLHRQLSAALVNCSAATVQSKRPITTCIFLANTPDVCHWACAEDSPLT